MNKPRIRVEQAEVVSILRFPDTNDPEWPWFVVWGRFDTLESIDESMRESPDMLRDWKIATGRA